MTEQEYENIKKKVILSFSASLDHDNQLEILKKNYKSEINSPRRYEMIKTLGQLLDVLEQRDILSYEDIKLLKNLARSLNKNEILTRIDKYQCSHKPKEHYNYYAHLKDLETTRTKESASIISNIIVNTISEKKRERILRKVTQEIGLYWKDLGRNLDLREGDIDEIDADNFKLAEKASVLLQKYEEECDPQRWFFNLCNALEKSSRRDLSKKIQEIMTMNLQ